VDDAFDLIAIVYNGEIGEAGFVKFVESERAENVGFVDEDHFGLWNHNGADGAVVKAHNGGDAVAGGVI